MKYILIIGKEEPKEILNIVEEYVSTIVSLQKVVEEETRRSEYQSPNEYYKYKTKKQPAYFARIVVDDWIPWIEELGGRRVISRKPFDDYGISGLRSLDEVAYLQNELEGDVLTITDESGAPEFAEQADLVTNYDGSESENRSLIRSLDDFLNKGEPQP